MKKYFLLFLVFIGLQIIHTQAQTEITRQGDLSFIKLSNGLNIILHPNTSSPQLTITLTIKYGSIYEPDSFSGMANVLQHIYAEKIGRHLGNFKNTLNNKNCSFVSYCTTEQSIFKFKTSQAYASYCLTLIADSILQSSIYDKEINYVKEKILSEVAEEKTMTEIIDSTIMRRLFRHEYYRVTTTGDVSRFPNFTWGAVMRHKLKYYKSDNVICSAEGSFSQSTILEPAEKILGSIYKGDYNPESITKIIDIKPMIFSTQLVFEDSVDQPEFQICYQLPGAYSNQKFGYKSYLLSSILNDKNNYLHVKAAKLGCKKLSFQYEGNNFSAVFRVVFQPDKQHLMETYNMILNEMKRIDKVLINESMVTAGKYIFKKEFDVIKKSPEYVDWIVKFWPYNDDNFFYSLSDSVMSVQVQEMQKFTHEYIYENAYASVLRISLNDRIALKTDSQFVDLSDTIMQYTFSFRPNVTQLEGAENDRKLNNLLQWLRVNNDIQVQVNGFSDEGEYGKVSDDSVLLFIDSIPTFRKAMPDVIKKRSMRPETMRAMRIVKYLYDNGISADRLKGTSMVFSSSNREEALANMKCTLTLEKLRDRISLYEYHYGKKYNR